MAARLSWATPRRVAAVAALVAVVVALHAWVTHEVSRRMADFGREQAMPQRMTVTYVREMQLAAPLPVTAPVAPQPPPKPKPKRRPRQAAPPAAVASAPVEAPADEPAVEEGAMAAAAPPADEAASAPAAAEPAAAEPAVAAEAPAASEPAGAGATPFEWPPSTRVAYDLTGNYRGEVQGDAQVEWIKAGSRYQVHVDLSVGPRFAPLVSRRMSSEGDLTATGLTPSRYDEETRMVLRDPRRATVVLGPDEILLANGERKERVAGVQDSASQFIQLAVLFALRPELLQPGSVVEILLALPRSVDVWVYDVLAEETLATPIGGVATFHLKPRRASRKPSDLTAELWVAPALRYLPARIRIEQDKDTYVDLMIARKPELGAP